MLLSIISHYYNNQRAVERMLKMMRGFSDQRPHEVDLVLVDDHSHTMVDPNLFDGINGLRVFRIIEDVAWNMPAARNIGAKEALADVLLFLDIDHIFDLNEVESVLTEAEKLQPGQIGQFRRMRRFSKNSNEWSSVSSHINSFLLRKSDFSIAGGYDETFSGNYGHEDKFFKACCRRNGIREVQLEPTLFNQSLSTSDLDRDKSVNTPILERLLAGYNRHPEKVLTYKWTQIYPSNESRK